MNKIGIGLVSIDLDNIQNHLKWVFADYAAQVQVNKKKESDHACLKKVSGFKNYVLWQFFEKAQIRLGFVVMVFFQNKVS